MAGLATSLFIVHPLRVEPVAWVSGQAYLPCTFFGILSILCYLKAHKPGKNPGAQAKFQWFAALVALYAASLLFKAGPLGLPGVLLVLDIYPLHRLGLTNRSKWERSQRHIWLEKLPYTVLSPIFGILAVAAKRFDHTLVQVEGTRLIGRLALACYSVWFYLVKALWPVNLHAFPMRPEPLDWTQAPYVLSILGVIVVSVSLYYCHRRHSAFLATWIAYLVQLAPTSGLVTYGRQAIGDRYSYVAAIPWFILLAGGLYQWSARGSPTCKAPISRQRICLPTGLVRIAILTFVT